MKPLLSHLNPDYTLSPQLRVDGGELSSKCVPVDHLLDKIAQLFRMRRLIYIKGIADGKLTLVALCRATSAKLQDFDEDIDMSLRPSRVVSLRKSRLCRECGQSI